MIRFRVRAVLELSDSVTGRAPSRSLIRVTTPDSITIHDKGSGLLAFSDDGSRDEVFEIRLESPVFLEEKITVEPCEPGKPLIRQIRLLPSKAYPVPQSAASILGQASPDTAIRFWVPSAPEDLRLFEDLEPGSDRIRLCDDRTVSAEGLEFRLGGRSLSCFIRLGRELERTPQYTEYELVSADAGERIRKGGVMFQRVISAQIAADGTFLAVFPAAGDGITVRVRLERDGKTCESELKLSGGEKRRLDEEELWALQS